MTRPVVDGVFRADPPRLLGARCDGCGNASFPRLEHCPYCGSDAVVAVELAAHGTLWGWTTVLNAPPGYLGTVPYGFGVVELPEGVRIVTRLAVPDATWEHGQPMMLRIVELGPAADGDMVTTWEFAP
ncbi:MAG: OB-fold domain-containing protein [Acidimicrobiia bacterium]|nr:OB-fold domain-containing protein [Acidimicrobiia bacterium]